MFLSALRRSVGRSVFSNASLSAPSSVSFALRSTRSFATTFPQREPTKAKTTTTTAKVRTTVKKLAAKKPVVKAKKPAPKKKAIAKKPAKKVVKAKPTKPKSVFQFKQSEVRPPFKKPMNSWANFANEYYNKHKAGEGGIKNYLAGASEEWKSMSEEEKQKYAPPQEEITDYYARVAEYRKTLSPHLQEALARKRANGKFTHRRNAPRSIYAQFVAENFNKHHQPGLVPFAETSKLVTKLYHELSKPEIEALYERAAKDWEDKQAAQKRAQEEYDAHHTT